MKITKERLTQIIKEELAKEGIQQFQPDKINMPGGGSFSSMAQDAHTREEDSKTFTVQFAMNALNLLHEEVIKLIEDGQMSSKAAESINVWIDLIRRRLTNKSTQTFNMPK